MSSDVEPGIYLPSLFNCPELLFKILAMVNPGMLSVEDDLIVREKER